MSRSLGVNGSPEASMPEFWPRRYDLKVIPSLSYRPLVASLPLTTPIEPVMVASSAKIVLGAAGDVIAAAAGDVAHRDDERLLGLHAAGGVEDDLAGQGRAARRIDPQDDGLDRVVAGRRVERPANRRARRDRVLEERRALAPDHDRSFDVDDADGRLLALGLTRHAQELAPELEQPEGDDVASSLGSAFLPYLRSKTTSEPYLLLERGFQVLAMLDGVDHAQLLGLLGGMRTAVDPGAERARG